MPEVQLKQLHMATSMEALNQKLPIDTNVNPKMLVKSARTILNRAESSDKIKDEELAYIFFMRYYTIIQAVKIHADYKKDKKFYDSILGQKKIEEIIKRAEALSKSLSRRYGLLANMKTVEKKEEEEKQFEEMERKREKQLIKKAIISSPKVLAEDGFIGCAKLYSLLKEKVSSFLVVDVRPKEDFKNSFMKISTMINIPEELLKPGLTANKAGRELNEDSRSLWERRRSFDYIIICDLTTEALPLPSPITVLIEAMEKWDPGKKYAATPVVLRGGFEMFSFMYPMIINSRVDMFSKTVLSSSQSNSLCMKNESLFNFEFPDLDTGFLSTPSPDRRIEYPELGGESLSRPSVNRNLKPKPGSILQVKEDSIDSFKDSVSSNVFNEGMMANSLASTDSTSSYQFPSGLPIIEGWTSPPKGDSGDQSVDSRTRKPVATYIKDSLPSIPSRALKPQELLENLKAKKNELEEEQTILEQSFRAEKDTLEKLKEMEETHKIQEVTNDEVTQMKLSVKESRLKDELKERKIYTQEMERKYASLHKQNEDMRNLLSQLFSGQLKIDSSGSPIHMNTNQKEEKEALRASEEKRILLLTEVEEMRRKRKEKERELKEEEERKSKEKERILKEEEERKREREEKKKRELEEAKEQFRWASERNSRNKENFPVEYQNGKGASSKRIGGETYTTKLRTSPRASPVRGGSNMKRSHSALNLSQLRDETSFDSVRGMPSFDRTMKPLNSPRRRNVNAARQRNFEPKYGSVGPTKTGLKNLGNTCYMNSIIQCLSNTFPLAKYFLEGQDSEDINPKSNQKGEIAEEVGAVVRAMWCGQYRSIAIWDLKSVVGRYHKAFQGYDQHDSHEFLIRLMDWLHDDLNLVSERHLKMEEQNFENIPDYVAAQSVIDSLQERDESMVRDLFHGLHRSVLVCHTCDNRSLTFEPFSILTVSFPQSGRCTLKDMLYDYYKETRLEYKCSKCRRMRTCTRKFDIWKLPSVLIIHLSRFELDVLTKKKQNFVDFPLDNLNLSEYTAGSNRFYSFDLYGVSNHYGTIDGGHYTAFCKSPHKSWYKFDDHEVYDLPREAVRTSAAYILFYEVSSQKSAL